MTTFFLVDELFNMFHVIFFRENSNDFQTLCDDPMRITTLDYLINVPNLLSVPADKFPEIPVRLLDRE